MNLIASSLPGRLRLHAPALRRTAPMRRLAADLAGLPGVVSVTDNARAGSLLLHYDAARVARADFEAAAARAAEKVLGAANPPPAGTAPASVPAAPSYGNLPAVAQAGTAPSPAPAPPRHLVAPSLRVRINRQAKRGMLASLLISLLLAAAGAKRGHVWTGGVFLFALALHLYVHRRHLLR